MNHGAESQKGLRGERLEEARDQTSAQGQQLAKGLSQTTLE